MGETQEIGGDPAVPVPADLAHTGRILEQLVQDRLARNDNTAELPLREPYRWNDCGWLANRWSELLPLAPHVKQRLMELDNPLLRLELVSDLIGGLGQLPPRGTET